jgi:hypothetical protein
MFLKRRTRRKDGKEHVYYSVCESVRVHDGRTVQRQLLHLGELNTTQHDSWQHTLDVLDEDGSRHQRRLFIDREGAAPATEEDVVEVKLSSFAVKQPRRFGDCWAGCHAWEELGLRAFWQEQLAEEAERCQGTTRSLARVWRRFSNRSNTSTGRRVWVFDRGIVSEENLALLRERGAHYPVSTPKRKLQAYEQKLLDGLWTKASAEVEVQVVPENDEVNMLCRSAARKTKEKAMRWRWLRGLVGDLHSWRRRVALGQLKNADLIHQGIGRSSERHPQAWRWVLDERDPAKLWATYIQLTEPKRLFAP